MGDIDLLKGGNRSLLEDYINNALYAKDANITSVYKFLSLLTVKQRNYLIKNYKDILNSLEIPVVIDENDDDDDSVMAELSIDPNEEVEIARVRNVQRIIELEKIIEELTKTQPPIYDKQLEQNSINYKIQLEQIQNQYEILRNDYAQLNNIIVNERQQFQNYINGSSVAIREQKLQVSQLEREANSLRNNEIKQSLLEPPELTIDSNELTQSLNRIDDSLTSVTTELEYNVTKVFNEIDSVSNNQYWTYIYQLLVYASGSKNFMEFSNERLKMLLVLVEGALRQFPDTSIDETMRYIAQRIDSGKVTFRDPLFMATRHTSPTLQSLIQTQLSSMYHQRYDVMPTLSSLQIFKRHIPVTGLNTYRLDPNNAKSSIYIYKNSTLGVLEAKKTT